MTTIISIRCTDGTQRHCDAHCYNALRKRCKCVCNEVNHGVGLEIALKNNRELTNREIADMLIRSKATVRPIIATEMELRDQLALEIARRNLRPS